MWGAIRGISSKDEGKEGGSSFMFRARKQKRESSEFSQIKRGREGRRGANLMLNSVRLDLQLTF